VTNPRFFSLNTLKMASYQWGTATPPRILGDTFTSSTRVSVLKPDSTLGNYTTWKTVAKVVATSNVASIVGVQTIDGVTLSLGDKVLLAGQTSGVNNGLYIVKLNTWEYAGDFPLGEDAAGLTVLINQGTVNANTIYVCTNHIGAGIIGTNSLVFSYMIGLNGVVGPATSVDGSVPVFSGTTGHILADATNVGISGGVLTAASGLTATTGNVTATAGNVVVSTATNGVNLTKGTVTIANFAAGAASVTARQGIITITDASLAGDAVGTIVVTATGMVAATDLILVGVNARSATDGGPVLQVTARTAPNSFTIVCKNADDATGMTGSMNIGYVIM
jgi:hypothetical protein